MPFAIWEYTDGAGGTGLMWVYPPKNIFEFLQGNFKHFNFETFFTTEHTPKFKIKLCSTFFRIFPPP